MAKDRIVMAPNRKGFELLLISLTYLELNWPFFETIFFLTRERMRSTSYRELWTNVSLDRWAVNFMQIRYASSLLLNCCLSLIKISCFKGLN